MSRNSDVQTPELFNNTATEFLSLSLRWSLLNTKAINKKEQDFLKYSGSTMLGRSGVILPRKTDTLTVSLWIFEYPRGYNLTERYDQAVKLLRENFRSIRLT